MESKPPGWATHRLENNDVQGFSPRTSVLSPTQAPPVRVPRRGNQPRSVWLCRPWGLTSGVPNGLREIDFTLKGTPSGALRHKRKAPFDEILGQNPLPALESLGSGGERRGAAGSGLQLLWGQCSGAQEAARSRHQGAPWGLLPLTRRPGPPRPRLQQLQLGPQAKELRSRAAGPLSQSSRSVMSDPLGLHGLHPARLPCPSPPPGACSNSCPFSQ